MRRRLWHGEHGRGAARGLIALVPCLLALAGCAGTDARLARQAAAWRADTAWAFEKSDVAVDPAFRFGRLPNGLRYIVRRNALPAGTAMVRMEVSAGSLDERDDEQGYAHFVEHLAFDGSAHVPEGEMVRLLEREGLAFGADTNASTSFARTTYMLDLPRADPGLLDTALMLMRETAGELSFSPAAVMRERGVVLAEMRDRNTYAWRNTIAEARFFAPVALYPRRFPIGTPASLAAATPERLRAFWRREYVPAHVTLVVVGDLDPALVAARIADRFGDWAAAPAPAPPDAGPVRVHDRDRTAIYIDPALSERVVAARNARWRLEPDTLAQRREDLLRAIGYAIVNRRLARLARLPDPPFRDAGFGGGDVFEAARATRLVIDSVDGRWRRGLDAAARTYRGALAAGFSAAEVAEQLANYRAALTVAARAADTRGNAELVNAALALVRDRVVPSDPRDVLARFAAFAPAITPTAVLGALKADATPLAAPLIRFSGRREPGGAAAVRAAWRRAIAAAPDGAAPAAATAFAYTDFGAPGAVTSDAQGPLGIRELRFANGVMLNLRRTDIEADRVQVRVRVDGGERLDTRANPLATEMFDALAGGGLGRHSEDELQTLLAGHSVSLALGSDEDGFAASGATTPDDLALQLEWLAAMLTDPGYRHEGEVRYRLGINNFFARKDATPGSALGTALGGILSDGDPRFALQPLDAYRRLSFARLRSDVSERLAHGAIEIGVVGDIDEASTIALVAKTFGALPPREPAFGGYAGQPPRPFTASTAPRVVRHTAPVDQALLRLTWPTRDDADPVAALRLELLQQVARIALTEALREQLGKAYSPSAASAPSHVWPGYGTFALAASIDVADVPATRAAIARTLAALRDAPVSDNVLLRARAPMLAAYDNGLKTNTGWMWLAARAQSEPDRIARYRNGKAILQATTAADLMALARGYLDPARGVEVLALPQGVAEPPR